MGRLTGVLVEPNYFLCYQQVVAVDLPSAVLVVAVACLSLEMVGPLH